MSPATSLFWFCSLSQHTLPADCPTIPNHTDPCTCLLQEATELSELFQRIEATFASGDLGRIADDLATMRRSLRLVGNVPEFKGGGEQVEVRPGACFTCQLRQHCLGPRLVLRGLFSSSLRC